jgi:hypothetical protein
MNIKNRIMYDSGLQSDNTFRTNEENADCREIKLLDMQARLLKAFQEFSNSIKSFKWDMDGSIPRPYGDHDLGPEKALKDLKLIKSKLAHIAKEKIEVINKLIDVIFGEPGEEYEDDKDEEDDEDEEEESEEDEDEEDDEDWEE